jgi:bud emergence protein 1
LRYRDESTGDTPPMISDNDLDLALQRNDKLIIYADYN